MPALGAFLFGMVHAPPQDKWLIPLVFSEIFRLACCFCTFIVRKSDERPCPDAPTRSPCQSFQNGAIGPAVTLTINRQMSERVPHVREFRDAPIQFRNMFQRDCLDLSTSTLPVLPQGQEFANIVHQKAEPTCLPNKT